MLALAESVRRSARPIAPHAPTVCHHVPGQPCRPSNGAVLRPLVGMSSSAQQAETWSTALLPARTSMVPRVSMQRPPIGGHSSGRSSCRSRTFWSPLRSPRHSTRWLAHTTASWTPCCFTPPLPPYKPWLWPPTTSVGRSAWGASSTPGPGTWPPIRMSIPSSLVGPCHPRARSGSRPAVLPGWYPSERSPRFSVASSRQH